MREMRYLSICSGIEAASIAWEPLGWIPVAFAEIDKFPSAVLKARWPHVPNLGDFTKITRESLGTAIDLLVGGTPCQAFSIAGLRGGLDDARGNLALEYLKLAQRLRPQWVVWENVPGILSSTSHSAPDPCPPPPPMDLGCDGAEMDTEDEYVGEELHALNCFLAGLSELGYGWAYRVLDAQYIRVDGYPRAVPQRRRRVFVVGYLGDWRRAAAVLFEPEGMQGHPPPRREAGKAIAGTLSVRAGGGGHPDGGDGRHSQLIATDVAPTVRAGGNETGGDRPYGTDTDTCESLVLQDFGGNNTSGPIDVATAVNAHGGPAGRLDFESETFVAHTLKAEGFDASEDGTGRGIPLVPVVFDETQITSGENRSNPQPGDPSHPIPAHGRPPTVAFSCKDYGNDAVDDVAPTLRAMGHDGSHANAGGQLAVAFNARQDPDVSGDVTHPIDTDGASVGVLQPWRVRRLTPTECARLQGFPEDHCAITYRGKPAADGPQYKAYGNSMAIPVMRWIGMRIDLVERIPGARKAILNTLEPSNV